MDFDSNFKALYVARLSKGDAQALAKLSGGAEAPEIKPLESGEWEEQVRLLAILLILYAVGVMNMFASNLPSVWMILCGRVIAVESMCQNRWSQQRSMADRAEAPEIKPLESGERDEQVTLHGPSIFM
jgi:hypothetical protein